MSDNSFARQNRGRSGMGRAALLRDQAPGEGVFTRERAEDDTKEKQDRDHTVRGMPLTLLPADPSDWLCHQAMVHMLGQYVDISHLQAHFMNRIFYDRPGVLPLSTWFKEAIDPDSGVSRQLRRTFTQNDLEAHRWQHMDRAQLAEELAFISQACVDFTPQLLALCELTYDMAADQYDDLTKDRIFTPFAAAGYMMATRQKTEHVMLTRQILSWANRMPPLRHPVSGKAYSTPFPNEAPATPAEYMQIEYAVRRAQRLYFRFLTSAQAHIVIHQNDETRD